MKFISSKLVFLNIAVIFLVGLCATMVSCDISEGGTVVFTDERLELIHVYDLDVPEPSGLALNADKSALYVVSDPLDNRVRKLSLNGQVQGTLAYTGDDLEGIAFDTTDSTLWVVEERKREIVHLDTLGNELDRISVSYTGNENAGFEGITLGANNNFFVLNEMDPGMILKIDAGASILTETEPGTALDYSGICYIPEMEKFFVVSDESKQLMIFNANLVLEDVLIFAIEKAEGIDYDYILSRLYIVSYKEKKLYVYELNLEQEMGNKRR